MFSWLTSWLKPPQHIASDDCFQGVLKYNTVFVTDKDLEKLSLRGFGARRLRKVVYPVPHVKRVAADVLDTNTDTVPTATSSGTDGDDQGGEEVVGEQEQKQDPDQDQRQAQAQVQEEEQEEEVDIESLHIDLNSPPDSPSHAHNDNDNDKADTSFPFPFNVLSAPNSRPGSPGANTDISAAEVSYLDVMMDASDTAVDGTGMDMGISINIGMDDMDMSMNTHMDTSAAATAISTSTAKETAGVEVTRVATTPQTIAETETLTDKKKAVKKEKITKRGVGVDTTNIEDDSPMILFDEEAFYLHQMGLLELQHTNGSTVSQQELWEKFVEKNVNFPLKFKLYAYFRDQNYVVKTGIHYGLDYAVYRTLPSHCHSECCALLVDGTQSIDVSEGKSSSPSACQIGWRHISTLTRVMPDVMKILLVCYVQPKWFDPKGNNNNNNNRHDSGSESDSESNSNDGEENTDTKNTNTSSSSLSSNSAAAVKKSFTNKTKTNAEILKDIFYHSDDQDQEQDQEQEREERFIDYSTPACLDDLVVNPVSVLIRRLPCKGDSYLSIGDIQTKYRSCSILKKARLEQVGKKKRRKRRDHREIRLKAASKHNQLWQTLMGTNTKSTNSKKSKAAKREEKRNAAYIALSESTVAGEAIEISESRSSERKKKKLGAAEARLKKDLQLQERTKNLSQVKESVAAGLESAVTNGEDFVAMLNARLAAAAAARASVTDPSSMVSALVPAHTPVSVPVPVPVLVPVSVPITSDVDVILSPVKRTNKHQRARTPTPKPVIKLKKIPEVRVRATRGTKAKEEKEAGAEEIKEEEEEEEEGEVAPKAKRVRASRSTSPIAKVAPTTRTRTKTRTSTLAKEEEEEETPRVRSASRTTKVKAKASTTRVVETAANPLENARTARSSSSSSSSSSRSSRSRSSSSTAKGVAFEEKEDEEEEQIEGSTKGRVSRAITSRTSAKADKAVVEVVVARTSDRKRTARSVSPDPSVVTTVAAEVLAKKATARITVKSKAAVSVAAKTTTTTTMEKVKTIATSAVSSSKAKKVVAVATKRATRGVEQEKEEEETEEVALRYSKRLRRA